jgi:hypothetical protein
MKLFWIGVMWWLGGCLLTNNFALLATSGFFAAGWHV